MGCEKCGLALSDRIGSSWFGEIAFFHNKIDDLMQGVDVQYPAGSGSFYSQNQNVGEGTFKGVELSLNGLLTPQLEVGGNYTYTDSDIRLHPGASSSTLTHNEIPRHSGMIYAKWQPSSDLSLMPYVESASSRWSTNTVTGRPDVKTGAYTLLNFRLAYQLTPQVELAASGHNLLDKNYALTHGYPQQGRNFIVSARVRY